MPKMKSKKPPTAPPPGPAGTGDRPASAPRIFQWKAGGGGGFGVPAQVVGEELERLEVKPGDGHRAHDVLDSARKAGSPLHGCFNWDNAAAAEAHRLDAARRMLRSISYVVVREHKVRTKSPVYVHVRDAQGPRYVPVEKVRSDAEVRRLALDEALALLNGVRRRYSFLEELDPLFRELDRLSSAG